MLDKKQITFRDLCNEININGTTPKMIYGDYKFTSNYVHTQNMNIKLFKFTFYERIFHILWIMVNYIINSLNLTIDKRTVTYKKLNMLEYDIDYNIAYLHDKILGKYDYIEKILEETTE